MPSEESFFKRPGKEGGGEKAAIRIVIEGRVQKVGLRNWIKQTAGRLGVFGWVRNKGDGTVEAFLCGEKGAVNELIKLCYQGPSFAHVKKIKEFPQTSIENPPNEFIILPTI
jgi:acylphosphatase